MDVSLFQYMLSQSITADPQIYNNYMSIPVVIACLSSGDNGTGGNYISVGDDNLVFNNC